MPELCRFLGIIICMHFNDHLPAHFHVLYNEFSASISIDSLSILEGKLPARVYSLIVEWALTRKSDLNQNWKSLHAKGTFKKIRPLV